MLGAPIQPLQFMLDLNTQPPTSQVDLHHPASVDHAGWILPTFLGHVGSSHSASIVHAEGTRSTSDVQLEPPHPTSASHV